MKVVYTQSAYNDIARLKEFIAIKNPLAATRISNTLVQKITELALHPKQGKQVNDSPNPDRFREIYILDYHIRYMFSDKTLMILRVWHQKEDR
jgi:plasmid stabilization system protein ParE